MYDEDVDVEQCSDSESGSGAPPPPIDHRKRSPESRPTGGDKSTDSPPTKKEKKKEEKVRLKPKCNCEELLYVDCHLETKELWDKFNELGTETDEHVNDHTNIFLHPDEKR